MYEVDGLPAEAVDRCNAFDEVWVPSTHNQAVFAKAGVVLAGGDGGEGDGRRRRDRLRAVPEGFDPAVFFCGPRQPACAGEARTRPAPLRREPTWPPEPDGRAVIDWLADAAADAGSDTARLHVEEGRQGLPAAAAGEAGTDGEGTPPGHRWGGVRSEAAAVARPDEGEDGQLPLLMQDFLGFDGRGHRPLRQEAVAAGGKVQPVVFLSVFKWEERKGWRELLKAFWAEFWADHTGLAGGDPAQAPRLLIKTSYSCKEASMVHAADDSGEAEAEAEEENDDEEEDEDEDGEEEHEEEVNGEGEKEEEEEEEEEEEVVEVEVEVEVVDVVDVEEEEEEDRRTREEMEEMGDFARTALQNLLQGDEWAVARVERAVETAEGEVEEEEGDEEGEDEDDEKDEDDDGDEDEEDEEDEEPEVEPCLEGHILTSSGCRGCPAGRAPDLPDHPDDCRSGERRHDARSAPPLDDVTTGDQRECSAQTPPLPTLPCLGWQ